MSASCSVFGLGVPPHDVFVKGKRQPKAGFVVRFVFEQTCGSGELKLPPDPFNDFRHSAQIAVRFVQGKGWWGTSRNVHLTPSLAPNGGTPALSGESYGLALLLGLAKVSCGSLFPGDAAATSVAACDLSGVAATGTLDHGAIKVGTVEYFVEKVKALLEHAERLGISTLIVSRDQPDCFAPELAPFCRRRRGAPDEAPFFYEIENSKTRRLHRVLVLRVASADAAIDELRRAQDANAVAL